MDTLSFFMERIKELLEAKYLEYNTPDFIENDPISIPHSYTRLQDIEITAFWTAILSWGQRVTIINKARQLFGLMDNSPYDFVMGASGTELKALGNFVHRTFQGTDALYFVDFFRRHYAENESLESAFLKGGGDGPDTLQNHLIAFRTYFFDCDYAPARTGKHVSTPASASACKRILMFLRWMVRKDSRGVDFGIWKSIHPSQLYIPFDVHVERVSRGLGLISRKQKDWRTVVELTERLREMDREDPVKYDYALFGMGLEKRGGLR